MNVTYLNSYEMKKFQNIHKLYLPKRNEHLEKMVYQVNLVILKTKLI